MDLHKSSISRFRAGLFAIIMAAGCLIAQPSQTGLSSRERRPRQDAGITLALAPDATGRKYLASLRNGGETPLFLVIGAIEANDKWLCPNMIELLVTGPDGKVQHSSSTLGCNPSGAIAGRLDPFAIPLAAGATYSLPVLNLRIDLPGRYTLKAKYTGVLVPLRSLNSDVQGLSLIHYWSGTVESNTISADIR
jgi:hypothetical protein